MKSVEFKKYEEYKESGVEWLGEIPKEWELLPIRALFNERKQKNKGPVTDFILSVTKDRGVIPYDEKGAVGNNKSEDIERYKVVHPNDLVINKMNVVIGSLGLSKYHGALSQVYIVLYPKNKNFYNNYFAYIFSNSIFYKSLIKYCTGIMELRESLNMEDFKKIILPIPSLKEQIAIANFLDEKCNKINKAIAQKEKLIELLNERKQIIIQKAVTKGLNPEVEMKESEVGKIPKKWEVISLRRILAKIEQGHSPSLDNKTSQDLCYTLKISAVKKGRFYIDEKKEIAKNLFKKEYSIKNNDFLLTRGNTPELVGDSCIVNDVLNDNIMIPDLIYRLKFNMGKVNLQYMLNIFQSHFFRTQIKKTARGSSSSMVKVSQEHIKSWKIPFPPKEEQNKITLYLEFEVQKIENAIELQEKQIKKLKEYRAILIDNAVTGKIKVGD